MTFEEDTKKILEFFDNKELQKIFENNFIHREKLVKAWDKLMDKTDLLHDLECGSCDEEVKEFEMELGL